MRVFSCTACGNAAHFENAHCVHCGSELGFLWPERRLVVLSAPTGRNFRCEAAQRTGCNWLVSRPGELCASCVLTRVRPPDRDGLKELRTAEQAKRRLLFELGELGLPVQGAAEREGGLVFDLLSSERQTVVTGHSSGVITLDLAESDAAYREALRDRLGERYRTVLGHFRHEIGHYYEPILLPDGSAEQARGRELFGDEREDYESSMQSHYAEGAPTGWPQRFVSAYATMHPWEDWAETFAHFLHIRDAMQTAVAYGLTDADPTVGMRELLATWTPLSIALNALNHSMGLDDVYPFVLTGPVVDKLAFVDEVVRGPVTA